MATTEQLPPAPGLPGDEQQERDFARKLAERYRFAFIDLREQRIDAELFRTIPADLMFRYNFVPLEVQNNVLAIAAADPGQVQKIGRASCRERGQGVGCARELDA